MENVNDPYVMLQKKLLSQHILFPLQIMEVIELEKEFCLAENIMLFSTNKSGLLIQLTLQFCLR